MTRVFPLQHGNADTVLPHPSYRRLREIKAAHDPGQAIFSAHYVRPAGS